MPKSGVIWFMDRPICYDCHDEANWLAQEVGRPEAMVITPELREAIMKDRAHQASKLKPGTP